jgi:hypothetical protein
MVLESGSKDFDLNMHVVSLDKQTQSCTHGNKMMIGNFEVHTMAPKEVSLNLLSMFAIFPF